MKRKFVVPGKVNKAMPKTKVPAPPTVDLDNDNMACGGKVKGYASGGTVRGMGAAIKGTGFKGCF